MTKQELEEYPELQREILLLHTELKHLRAQRHMLLLELTQTPPDDTQTLLLQRWMQQEKAICAHLTRSLIVRLRQARKIATFIDSFSSSRTRQIFRLRYLEGRCWQEVAHRIGAQETKDSVRMHANRFWNTL